MLIYPCVPLYRDPVVQAESVVEMLKKAQTHSRAWVNCGWGWGYKVHGVVQ